MKGGRKKLYFLGDMRPNSGGGGSTPLPNKTFSYQNHFQYCHPCLGTGWINININIIF